MERELVGSLVGVARMAMGTTSEALIVQHQPEWGTTQELVGLPVATVARITVGKMPFPTVETLLAQARLA
jgi:hypothetical protein